MCLINNVFVDCLLGFFFLSEGIQLVIFQHPYCCVLPLTADGLLTGLPSIVDAVKRCRILVIAGGGIVDGHRYVVALVLGAQRICIGTR